MLRKVIGTNSFNRLMATVASFIIVSNQIKSSQIKIFIYTIYYKIFLVMIILNLHTDGAGTSEIVELNKSGIPVTVH